MKQGFLRNSVRVWCIHTTLKKKAVCSKLPLLIAVHKNNLDEIGSNSHVMQKHTLLLEYAELQKDK